MQGDSSAPPGLHAGEEGVGDILVVHEPLPHFDCHRAAQHAAHAAHDLLYGAGPLQQGGPSIPARITTVMKTTGYDCMLAGTGTRACWIHSLQR